MLLTGTGNRVRPTISVVTVVRNDIAGLRRTAASIVLQLGTYPELEHVVVDGASTDECRAWPEQADPRLALTFHSEPDAGIYDAMNKGIARSTGDLLLFLNAGDRLKDADVLSFVGEDYAANSWSWAYGATDRWAGTRLVSHADKRPFDLQRLIDGRSWVPHQATFFTRRLLDEVGGYDLSMGIAADQELIIRCGLAVAPTTWDRTIADFETGGASEQITFWQHEREWLEIRRKLLARGRWADTLDYARTAGRVGNVNARRAARRAQRSLAARARPS